MSQTADGNNLVPQCLPNCPPTCSKCSILGANKNVVCVECIDKDKFKIDSNGVCVFISDLTCATQGKIFNPNTKACISCSANC